MGKPSCVWCKNSGGQLVAYPVTLGGDQEGSIVACNTDCGKRFLAYHNKMPSRGKYMPIGIGAAIAVGVFVAVWRIQDDHGALGVFFAFAGSGVSMILFPFTPSLFAGMLSPKVSVILARIMGACLILAGAVASSLVWTNRLVE